jgi:hypothetical protein
MEIDLILNEHGAASELLIKSGHSVVRMLDILALGSEKSGYFIRLSASPAAHI